MAAGFDGHLVKPVRSTQLKDCLSAMLGRKEGQLTSESNGTAGEPTATGSVKKRARILLAEDNAVNQMVALKILERFGYHAEAVSDGRQALLALREKPYDLVLMDCQMPEMDGMEAATAIRSSNSGVLNSKVPIIALTAHAMKGYRERCLEAGMNDYVGKPFRPKELSEKIELWLAAGPEEGAVEATPGESRIAA